MTSPQASITATIRDLAGAGFFAIPVRIYLSSGKKKSQFPRTWKNLDTVSNWKAQIADVIKECPNANSVAILTGISDLFVLDVDLLASAGKRSGFDLWEVLVAQHGLPDTLQAKTGSNGRHFYFRRNDSTGLTRRRNFAGLKFEGERYAIDGRGEGGVIFAPPSSYKDEDGVTYSYEWQNGDPLGGCNPMPQWLIQLVNSQGSDEVPPLIGGTPDDEPLSAEPISAPRIPVIDQSAIVREMRQLLLERAGDSTSTFGGTVEHGCLGTYYCFRVHGPRQCYFGRQHSGSNYFNCLKRGKRVYVRCHGSECSHEPPRYLGDLSLQTSLLDACREPLHDVDDYSVLNVRQMQGEELRLLIAFLTENVGESYSGLGRIFGYVFAKDGRILVTGPKKQFYYWNGRVWVLDESNRVIATFSYKMSTLFKWYDMRRDRRFERKLSEKGLVNGTESVAQTVAALDKRGSKAIIKACWDEVDAELPPNRINVNSPKEARACLDYVTSVLYDPEMIKLMDCDIDSVGCPNGVLDLRTGILSLAHPSQLCTRSTGVRYMGLSHNTDRFDAFVMDLFNSDESIVRWLRWLLGYALTGHTSEEIFCIWYGAGSNGKSALKMALQKAFGSYYTPMSKDCIIKAGGKRAEGAASSHLVALKGARLALCDESEESQVINSACIKEMTGGGAVTCRELFQKCESFVPTHANVLLTNHKPSIADADGGLLRRVSLLPFRNSYKVAEEVDPNDPHSKPQSTHLKTWLESSEGAEESLVWVVRGSVEWYARQSANPAAKVLAPLPAPMAAAFDEYLREFDDMRMFLEEFCDIGPTFVAPSADLLARFNVEMTADLKARAFGIALTKRGFQQIEFTVDRIRRRGFKGLRLRDIAIG
jgi:P4 family phage/plasmid primase-like protien